MLSAALSGLVAVLLLAFAVVVGIAETATAGDYLPNVILAVFYGVLSGALAWRDSRAVDIAGAALQLVVILAFLLFGVGAFQNDVLQGQQSVALWAGLITGCQAILMALLIHLAYSRRPA